MIDALTTASLTVTLSVLNSAASPGDSLTLTLSLGSAGLLSPPENGLLSTGELFTLDALDFLEIFPFTTESKNSFCTVVSIPGLRLTGLDSARYPLDSLTGLARFSGGRAYWRISGGWADSALLARELYRRFLTLSLLCLLSRLPLFSFTRSLASWLWLRLTEDWRPESLLCLSVCLTLYWPFVAPGPGPPVRLAAKECSVLRSFDFLKDFRLKSLSMSPMSLVPSVAC